MNNADNKDIAVNCSFDYNASTSCRVTPLMTNPDTNQNLTTTEIGFKNGYLWFNVIVRDDFVPTENSGLNVVFQCNIDGYQSYSIYKTNCTLPLSAKIGFNLLLLHFPMSIA